MLTHVVLIRANMSGFVCLALYLLPHPHVITVLSHCTRARGLRDDNFFIHILPFPGGKIYKDSIANSLASISCSLVRTIVSQALA